jgi:methanogenic corrinoid protein MtbC1
VKEIELAKHIEENAETYAGQLESAISKKLGQQDGLPGREGYFHCLKNLGEAVKKSSPALFAEFVTDPESCSTESAARKNKLLLHTQQLLLDKLPAAAKPLIIAYIQYAQVKNSPKSTSRDTFITQDNPHGQLATSYLYALLMGKQANARKVVMDAVDKAELDVEDVYMNVIQPVQYEIGRLWMMQEITVAEEHFATAVSQNIMSQMYDRIFSAPRIDRLLVATSVSGNLHEMGIRMITDMFELNGWDTYYLGANTPGMSVVETIAHRGADLLAISATLGYQVKQVRELIKKVRGSQAKDIKIMVGGNAFNQAPGLWRTTGADAYSADARSAVMIANSLMKDST